MFLCVASEMGLMGLIMFLGVLYLAFKTVVRIAQRSGLGTGIFVGLIVFMIAGMSLHVGERENRVRSLGFRPRAATAQSARAPLRQTSTKGILDKGTARAAQFRPAGPSTWPPT